MFSFKKHCQNTSTAPTPQGVFPWNPSFGPHIPGRPLYPRLPSRNKFGQFWQLITWGGNGCEFMFSASKCTVKTHQLPPHLRGSFHGIPPLDHTYLADPSTPGYHPATNSVFWQLRTWGRQLMRVHVFSFKKHCQNTSTAPTPQGVFPWNPSFGPHIPGRDLYRLLPSHNKFGVLAAKNMGSATDASSCVQLQKALSKHINCPNTSGGLSVESLLWTTHTWQAPLPPVTIPQQIRCFGS